MVSESMKCELTVGRSMSNQCFNQRVLVKRIMISFFFRRVCFFLLFFLIHVSCDVNRFFEFVRWKLRSILFIFETFFCVWEICICFCFFFLFLKYRWFTIIYRCICQNQREKHPFKFHEKQTIVFWKLLAVAFYMLLVRIDTQSAIRNSRNNCVC